MSGKGFGRKYPRGRISGDDDGEAPMAIAHDRSSNTVVFRFFVPTTWVGLGPNEVFNLLTVLAKHYSRMIGKVVQISIVEESDPKQQIEAETKQVQTHGGLGDK